MMQPERFISQDQEQKVCKLEMSIYGLKQASRSWNIRFDAVIKTYGFEQNVDEPCVYKRIIDNRVIFLVLYIDDILLIGNDIWTLSKILVQFLMQNFKKSRIPSRYGVHMSKEQCPKTPQEIEDMRRILYASVVGYTDSNFQLDKDSRKSTSGSVFTLDNGAMVWRSIKQSYIADSTMEAEYCEAAKDIIWLRKFLSDLEVFPSVNKPITLYCDNS
ncbi:hypothetical protein JRO89_XS14G0159900 [Xanthoceras sorbifolium]|uniref:Reverse transcriptase Ty1/copia-type domain-containing protein n=1 Tax=Xanthoceras sorbifolium TaxID=99658 RepID=A0ABQ8H5H2_9ROSI|nr:hypothetical protein JRO89_XS14G0159900 [Xanthoceras sorbifolium]